MSIKRFLIFLVSVCLVVTLHSPLHSQESEPLGLALQAQQLYQQGQLTSSAGMWQQALSAYRELGDRQGTFKSSIAHAQVLQDLGLYPKACNILSSALEVKNPNCSQQQTEQLIERWSDKNRITTLQGIALRSLGSVLQNQGRPVPALELLELSKSATANTPEEGATLLAIGNADRAIANRQRNRLSYNDVDEIILRQNSIEAIEPYYDAFLAYETAATNRKTPPITQIQAQLNYLNLSLEIERWWQEQTSRRIETWLRQGETSSIAAAEEFSSLLESRFDPTRNSLIQTIDRHWSKLTPSHQSVYARINYSRSLTKLGYTEKAASILNTALDEAKAIADPIGESYALGYLGEYYGQQGQLQRAIATTNQGLSIALEQNITRDVREVIYLWQSQLGQLFERQDKIDSAISAYTSAFDTLQSLRSDLNTSTRTIQFDFRDSVRPVYLHLADLLLRDNSPQALSVNAVNTQVNSNLELARQVIESLQLAELDDFFQNPCLETADTKVTIDRLDSQAAVIYPIVLRDRLEVILSLPGKPLQKFTTSIAETNVYRAIDLIYDSLYNPNVDDSAVNIFSTTPLNLTEVESNTATLLPSLEQFYSWLIEPLSSELATNQIKTLVFVLNGRLQHVPVSALYDGQQYLLEKYGVALTPSLQLLDPQPVFKNKVKVLAAGVSQQVEVAGNIFPPLNYVPQELNQIKEIFPQSRQLLDREFTRESIAELLQKDFSVVHLATHGLFSSDPEQTFIISGDRQTINIDTLSNLLSSSNTPPQLIVLSACETATGDDRAILGLAGMAVKSGTSSTLASLWSVEDASTARFMNQFYREFQNPTATKVNSLQKAQLSLIDYLRSNSEFQLRNLPPHPYFWAPYVLVGNWQ